MNGYYRNSELLHNKCTKMPFARGLKTDPTVNHRMFCNSSCHVLTLSICGKKPSTSCRESFGCCVVKLNCISATSQSKCFVNAASTAKINISAQYLNTCIYIIVKYTIFLITNNFCER